MNQQCHTEPDSTTTTMCVWCPHCHHIISSYCVEVRQLNRPSLWKMGCVKMFNIRPTYVRVAGLSIHSVMFCNF